MSDTTISEEGQLLARTRLQMAVPSPGNVRRFIITSAQNNTKIHAQCWDNLNAYAKHVDAEIIVATFTYSKRSMSARGSKRKTAKETDQQDEWWASELKHHIRDESIQLAPGLVWCGELQILPTAENPLAGLESYTGRQSSIIPHTKFAVQSIPSPKHAGTKFLYTTGTVTQRNYIQKKAGQKAEFHHGYGAVIVEVGGSGDWFVRQLCADSEGTFYDFNVKVEKGEVTTGHRPEAIVWGDIHERQLEDWMRELCWGERGILDILKPKRQVMHDLNDFRSQNHHEREDSWKVFKKFCAGKLNVEEEIGDAAKFLQDWAARDWCETVAVCSNHDMAFIRWLKEADFRLDPENARFFLRASSYVYGYLWALGEEPYPIEWAFRKAWDVARPELTGVTYPSGIKFLRRDESYVVCPDANDGIELGMHGDVGANGARTLNIRTFARTGRKCIIGHSHSAGVFEGAWQVGVTGSLDQGYNQGMSSWSHTNALVYPNGKRTLFTIWNHKWRA